MRILIQSEEENINLHIPNAIVFSSFATWIAKKSIKKINEKNQMKNKAPIEIQPDQLKGMMEALRKASHQYKGLELVSVDSKDEHIRIIL